MRRRDFIAGFGAAAWPLLASAQQPAPVTALFQLQGLDHVSLSVADGQRTIDFYRPIFGQEIYLRPNTAAEFRISLGGTPYLAVNPGRNIPPGTIDHFCIGVKESLDQIRVIMAREGIAFNEDQFVKDEDGTFVQFNQSADINPSIAISLYPKTPTVAGLESVFRPRGFDQVAIFVDKLDRFAGRYRRLCGPEIQRTDEELVFKIGPDVLLVREPRLGRRPGIDHFRVRVDQYDRAEAAKRMKALGTDLRSQDVGDAQYFVDPDGIAVYLAEAPFR